MNTAEEILSQLDHSATEFSFPALDNGYIYPGDVRLSVYRDAQNWLMIIEHLGANPRCGDIDSIQNCLHLYGSNLHRRPGTANEDFLHPVHTLPDHPVFDDDYDFYVRSDAAYIVIRDETVKFDISLPALELKGIQLTNNQQADASVLLRSLLPEYRDALLASNEELALRNPGGLPLWMQLDEWHHPDVVGNVLPSQSETFQMLASAIATGEKNKYRPIQPPNTHWSSWPEGGTL